MADANIVGSAADGYLQKYASTWAGCMAAAPDAHATDASYSCCRWGNGSNSYELDRAFLCFDLSPYAGATITVATLNVYMNGDGDGPCKVYYYDWGTSLAAADWSTGTACSSTQTPTSAAWRNISLTNPQGILTANGRVYLALDDETTDPGSSEYQFVVYFSEHATYKPNLDITYTTGFTGLTVTRPVG
jgi:hypothetical protein